MPAPGANLNYDNQSRIFGLFMRKLGLKARDIPMVQQTRNRNMTAATGVTAEVPLVGGFCLKFSTTTAPASNTAADAPSGIGDICVYCKSNGDVGLKIAPTNLAIYRCSAYTNNTTFTWTLLVPLTD